LKEATHRFTLSNQIASRGSWKARNK